MIGGTPEDSGFVKIVPDAWHEYFRREMGRPMDAFELQTLEKLKQDLEQANAKLARSGLMKMLRPEQDLLDVYIHRVREHEAAAVTKKIMVGYTGGRRG